MHSLQAFVNIENCGMLFKETDRYEPTCLGKHFSSICSQDEDELTKINDRMYKCEKCKKNVTISIQQENVIYGGDLVFEVVIAQSIDDAISLGRNDQTIITTSLHPNAFAAKFDVTSSIICHCG